MDEGQEDAGERQLLAGHIYWAFGSVLPLSDTVRVLSADARRVNSTVNPPRYVNAFMELEMVNFPPPFTINLLVLTSGSPVGLAR